MSTLTRSPAWQALKAHQKAMSRVHMRDLFRDDPRRFDRFSLEAAGLLLDYSKNIVSDETMSLLLALARQADVEGWRERMLSGDKINFTEGRSVLHTALRNRGDRPVFSDGEDVMPGVKKVLDHMRTFTEAVRG